LEKRSDQQTRAESKTRLVAQINASLRSGDYARALDLLRGAGADFPNDAQLSELEKLAQDGLKRKADADRLITESQGLFAQQKSGEAIQLLRQAYELDKNNSLARAILANALVEHAQALAESDWLKAETLTNQALALNPAHPTAKTILSLIIRKKETSSVEDWVSQAKKLQSSGDLFAALAWVAEGMAVHPHDPKLLQIQDAIQRDQDARRRQARRGDLDDLRRMQREIEGAADVAAKQAIAERIQAVAAKHWTDGEILSIANALLLRLGLVPQDSSSASPRSKGATVILHVPRPSAPKPAPADTSQIPPTQAQPTPVQPSQAQASQIPTPSALPRQTPSSQATPTPVPPEEVPTAIEAAGKALLRIPIRGKHRSTRAKATLNATPSATVPVVAPRAAAAKVTRSSSPSQPARSKSATLILVGSAAALILSAAIFFLVRRYQAQPVATAPAAAPAAPEPTVPIPPVSGSGVSTPAQTAPESSLPAPSLSSDSSAGNVPPDDQPPAESGHNLGTLLVVAGQDDARVFLNGKLQRQLTHAGEMRLRNLELKDYVVRVSKSGFQDPPQQKVRVRKGEEAKLIFNLQPQPHLASLSIQGGAPGTTVLVDQKLVGTIQPDGTLSVSTVNPGDHTVELRKERFKPRQFKEHFVAGGAVSLAPADAALEAAAAELKITFAPADAKVAIVKGDLLTIVSSGVPLNLAPGTYTLTARTADRFTRSSTIDVIAGQSKALDLSLAPNGMSKWDDPGAWKHEGDSFTRKGGDFALYQVVPTSGTFIFSAMLMKGRLLQWVLNYADSKNYVLFQMDDNNFYRSVIHNGNKTDEIIVPHKNEKKSFRTLHIRVTPTEILHQIKQGNSWTVLDRWTQPGANLSLGKFGFYIPGSDQVALSSFSHYADLNIR
jgi:tetratricopeptide (TPR) repeat protein